MCYMITVIYFPCRNTCKDVSQNEVERVCVSGSSLSPQEDPEQQLPDATQLWRNLHHSTGDIAASLCKGRVPYLCN